MERVIDITKRYSHELCSIANITRQLKKGRIYELTGIKMDGYLQTQVLKLEEQISELLYKIEYGQESFSEKIGNYFSNLFDTAEEKGD